MIKRKLAADQVYKHLVYGVLNSKITLLCPECRAELTGYSGREEFHLQCASNISICDWGHKWPRRGLIGHKVEVMVFREVCPECGGQPLYNSEVGEFECPWCYETG